eukprot:3787803-Prymnesium_polylepis.1
MAPTLSPRHAHRQRYVVQLHGICFCIGHRARITSAPQHATRTRARAPALAATAAPPSRSRLTSARAPRPDLRALRLGTRVLRAHALPAALVRREPQL